MNLDIRIVALQTFAIVVAYIMMQLPVAYAATQVNIFATPSGGDYITTEYDISQFVTFSSVIHQVRRGGPKVEIYVDGANEKYSVKKIFLYKCRNANPVECSRFVPQPYDTYVKTELDWHDISEREDSRNLFPQIANLLILVNIEDNIGDQKHTRWLGIWHRIVRGINNEFVQSTEELNQNYIDSIDVYAKSSYLADPIKTFIETTGMLPINWISKVVFSNVEGRYSVGADEGELQGTEPEFQSIQSSSNTLEDINKDYYFVFPTDSDGVSMPFTVNRNPSFTCGNGIPELGETEDTCCLDVECTGDAYCDWDGSSSDRGTCMNLDAISIDVVPDVPQSVEDCSTQVEFYLVVNINNAPSSLEPKLTGTLKLEGYSTRAVTCEEESGNYICPVTVSSPIGCGNLNYEIGPHNNLNLSLTFNDGSRTIVKRVGEDFGSIEIPYSCTCAEGKYCDIENYECKNLDPITLSAVFDETYITGYNQGDTLSLNARVYNPPTGMTVSGQGSNVALKSGQVDGSINCNTTSPVHTPTVSENYYDYPCNMSFTITGYDPENTYNFPENVNNLTFTISYPDGSQDNTKTRQISDNFGPIIIPAFTCGDGKCDINQGEDSTASYCCIDCGCPTERQPQCTDAAPCYCDKAYRCLHYSESDFTLTVTSMTENLEDCEISHAVYANVEIRNTANTDYDGKPPYNMEIDSCTHLVDGNPTGVTHIESCEPIHGPHSGDYNCTIIVEPENDCELSGPAYFDGIYYHVGGDGKENKLQCEISFEGIHRMVSGTMQEIKIEATPHCGDGVCESDIGENNMNCCLDCPCPDDTYYCAWSTGAEGDIGCKQKADLILAVSASAPDPGDSCEVSNEVKMTAVLETASGKPLPDDLVVLGYWAEIGGEKAQNFVCQPTEGLEGAVDYSYDCTLKIPPRDDCTSQTCTEQNQVCLEWNNPACDSTSDEGNKCVAWSNPACIAACGTDANCASEVDTDPSPFSKKLEICNCRTTCSCTSWCDPEDPANTLSLTGNKVYFRVALWDGQKRISYTVPGEFQDITITQNVRTIKDIVQDNIALLYDQLYSLQKREQKMLNTIETCIGVLVAFTIICILGTLTVGIVVGKRNPSYEGGFWKGMSDGLTAGSSLSNSILNTISQICEMVQKIHQMVVETIKLNMKMISMQLCLDTQQHMIDTGMCKGQEQSCFMQLANCIKFDEIDSAFTNMQDIIEGITNNANEIGKSWIETGKTWKDTFSPPKAPAASDFKIRCNGRLFDGSCCEYREKSNGKCIDSTIEFIVTRPDEYDCNDLAVFNTVTGDVYALGSHDIDDVFGEPPGQDGTGQVDEYVQLYCRDNERLLGKEIKIVYLNAFEEEEDCKCNKPKSSVTAGSITEVSANPVVDDNKFMVTWHSDAKTTENVVKIWPDYESCEWDSDNLRCYQNEAYKLTATSKKEKEGDVWKWKHTASVDMTSNIFFQRIGNSGAKPASVKNYDDKTFVFQVESKSKDTTDIFRSELYGYDVQSERTLDPKKIAPPEEKPEQEQAEEEKQPESKTIEVTVNGYLNIRKTQNGGVWWGDDGVLCTLANGDKLEFDPSNAYNKKDSQPGCKINKESGNMWYFKITSSTSTDCSDKAGQSGWACDVLISGMPSS